MQGEQQHLIMRYSIAMIIRGTLLEAKDWTYNLKKKKLKIY